MNNSDIGAQYELELMAIATKVPILNALKLDASCVGE
jgi:hypothetical protein